MSDDSQNCNLDKNFKEWMTVFDVTVATALNTAQQDAYTYLRQKYEGNSEFKDLWKHMKDDSLNIVDLKDFNASVPQDVVDGIGDYFTDKEYTMKKLLNEYNNYGKFKLALTKLHEHNSTIESGSFNQTKIINSTFLSLIGHCNNVIRDMEFSSGKCITSLTTQTDNGIDERKLMANMEANPMTEWIIINEYVNQLEQTYEILKILKTVILGNNQKQ